MAIAQEKLAALPPVIEFSTTQQYSPIWNDKGSGAHMDGAFYRPLPQEGFYILGDYGQGNYNLPSEPVLTIRVKEDDPEHPALKEPLDWQFVSIWKDKGSGAHEDGSVWAPVAPFGYVVCGHVFQKGYDMPTPATSPGLDKYRCLRYDLATQVALGGLIWNDKGSGADKDVAVYRVPSLNVVFAVPTYDPPIQGAYVPSALGM
jgi:hypothetical protein